MIKRRVFVIGLGLIGGSVALAIRKAHKDIVVSGFDTHEEAIDKAIALGVIDYGAPNIEECAVQADLIVLAAPVEYIQDYINKISSLPLKKEVIITDVGSTKRDVVETARRAFKGNHTFIGGHPMAGSHKSGVLASKSHLFENAFYFLTPNQEVQQEKLNILKDWLKGTKATFLTIDPEKHDYIVGIISHFPHIVASALVHQLAHFPDQGLNISRLAAGGFRDITRIASADPTMWQSICQSNRDVLLKLFDQWENEMARARHFILANDSKGIFSFFKEAKDFRDNIPTKEKGVIPPYYDLYVDVPDYPGIIAKITEIIANSGLSITNIRIIELREDIMGVLRLSFQSYDDRSQAATLLEENNYKTFIEN